MGWATLPSQSPFRPDVRTPLAAADRGGLARAADRVVRSPDRTAHFLEQGPKQTAHHAGRSRDLAGLVDEADLDAARSRARYLKAGPRHTEFDDDAPGIVDDAFTLAEFA